MQSPLNLNDYIDILHRRKFLLIVPLVVGVGIAVLISLKMSPMYRSTTTILVERQKVSESYVKSTVVFDMKEKLRTLKAQIMSRTRLEKIIEEHGLYYYDAVMVPNKFINKLLFRFGIKKKPPTREDIVNRMRKDINIVTKGNDLFQVSYIGPEPDVVMRVANALASMFIEENLKVREQRAEGTSEFLIGELEKAKQELERREADVRAFKEEYVGALPGQLDANLRTLDRLQLELQTINDAIKSANDRKILLEEQLSGQSDESNPLVRQISPLERELIDLRNTLSSLRVTFKDNYPDVIIVKNRIKEVKKLLSNNNDRSDEDSKDGGLSVSIRNPQEQRLRAELHLINSEIKTRKDREIRIKRQIKEFERRVEETPANEQLLITLQRDYGIMQDNYKALLEKKLNAQLSENMEKRQKGEQFRMLDPANLPEKPYGGQRMKVRLIGLAIGGGIGFALIFLVEFLNPAFHKPEDFLEATDIPVFAAIPRFSEKSMKK
ncbi:MAG: GumC family protein [Thermodesulfobacteriota bacterium]